MNTKLNTNLFHLFWLIVFSRLFALFLFPLTDTTEARYANIAYMMAKSGDWITPYYDFGVPFWGKPPLSFWCQALSFNVFGFYDFTARLPSLLVTLATVWLIYNFLIFISNKTCALLGIIIYLSMTLVYILSGVILTDTYLNFSTTLSLISFLMVMKGRNKYWGHLFFIGLGLGMLAKGPLTLVITGGVITLWITFSFKKRIKKLALFPWITGLFLMIIISLPWYILAELKTPGFLQYFIVGEHFNRFVSPGWNGDLYGKSHKQFYGYIWLTWLFTSLPWGLISLTLLIKNFKTKKTLYIKKLQDDYFSFYVIWSLFLMIFFTLSGNVLLTYILPSLPPLSIMLALYLARENGAFINRKFIYISSLSIPLLGLIATVFIIFNPTDVRTEKFLIEKYKTSNSSHAPIYFRGRQSFSAKYYYGEKINQLSLAEFKEILHSDPSKYYFVINKESISILNNNYNYKKLYSSRNYHLYLKDDTTETSENNTQRSH